MQEHSLESEESRTGMDFFDFSVRIETWFDLDTTQTKEFYGGDYHSPFTFYLLLSQDKTIHKRSIYNFFDWLGDVGGLLDGLRIIGDIIISMYNFVIGNPLNAFLVHSLFKRASDKVRNSD